MISSISRIRCLHENTARAVCIEPSCSSLPFVCNHVCDCQQHHVNHHLLDLDDFSRLISQKPQATHLQDWCEVLNEVLRESVTRLNELMRSQKEWMEAFLRGYWREQNTMEVFVGGTDQQLKQLTGRKMRRLFEERTRKIEVPFPYNFPKEKWYFVETLKPQLERKCSDLISSFRKLFDCKLQLKGLDLNKQLILKKLSEPHLDTILIHNCKFDSNSEFGWGDLINELANLKYLKKLRISECGIGSMMVKRIAMSLTQIIDLDLRANGIDKHGANAISEMKGLKFLNLSYNNVGDQGAFQLVTNLQNLRVLSLSINNISSDMSIKLRDTAPYTVDLYL